MCESADCRRDGDDDDDVDDDDDDVSGDDAPGILTGSEIDPRRFTC